MLKVVQRIGSGVQIGNNIIDITEINIEDIQYISISDIKGKEIIKYSKKQIETDGNNIVIKECDLITGIYFCVIRTKNSVFTKKFIISK